MRIVVAAAFRSQSGLVFYVPRPGRHHDIIRAAADAGIPTPITGTQGFIDNDGVFMNRKEAMLVALEAKQPIIREDAHNYPGGSLFSEDLW